MVGPTIQPRGLIYTTRLSPVIVGPTSSFQCTRICLFDMSPRLIDLDIPTTMETSGLRSPLTRAAPSRQTMQYVHIIRKGRIAVLMYIMWAPGDVPYCGRCMLVALVHNSSFAWRELGVHPTSQTCLAGTRSVVPPRRLARCGPSRSSSQRLARRGLDCGCART